MRNMHCLLFILIFLQFSCKNACQQEGTLLNTKNVFFKNINDNDKVSSPILVEMGVKNLTVRPALEDVNDKTSGHHHILIDSLNGCIPKGEVVPKSDKYLHFGGGETTATLELSKGLHTLHLQFADGAHLSYGEEYCSKITIDVQ